MTQTFFDALKTLRDNIPANQFDRTPTPAIISFEIFVVLGAIASLWILSKYEKKLLIRFFIIAIGIFIFELFTSPMWNNYKMGVWAYNYQDVSWILTVGWATLILWTTVMVDKIFANLQEWKRFGLYLVILTILVLFFESVVINLGIRSYAPETKEAIHGYFPFAVPIDTLYYVSVFMALVISFYKYWIFAILKKPIIPIKKRKWFRSLFISFLGIVLFELMIEPMVVNANLPRWSYIYRDVSFLMTGGWIVIVWLSTYFIDKFFIHYDLPKKFMGYLIVIFIISLPVESWLITNGFRVYASSTKATYSGFTLSIVNIPVEVAFAIPFYFALVVSFIKYWEIILDNENL